MENQLDQTIHIETNQTDDLKPITIKTKNKTVRKPRQKKEKQVRKCHARLPAKGNHFSRLRNETRDTHLGRKFVVGKTLGSRPLDGKFGTGVRRVGIVAHETRQTEVCHFD